MTQPLRIVVADDSGFMRRIIVDGLRRKGLDVVAEAANGLEALEACYQAEPDVLVLDLEMPELDGLSVLRKLAERKSAVRVVICSSFSPSAGARAIDLLAAGAIELVRKPAAGEPIVSFFSELAEAIVSAGQSRASQPTAMSAASGARSARPAVSRSAAAGRKLVLIACSTGGPKALATLVPSLPAPLGTGTLIVQHMPVGFTESLANRLDSASPLHVVEATDGAKIESATVLLAPGGRHLHVGANHAVSLGDEPAIGGLKPRADITIADAARVFQKDLLLVVLTGMGKDGLEGARDVKRYGGRIIVEAESSCVVYGMPRAISEAGLADAELPLTELAAQIEREVRSS